MGIALLAMLTIAGLSIAFVPAFGAPGFFYAWLGVNVAIAIAGIFFLVLEKDV